MDWHKHPGSALWWTVGFRHVWFARLTGKGFEPVYKVPLPDGEVS